MTTPQRTEVTTRRLARIPAQRNRAAAPPASPAPRVPPNRRGRVASWIATLALVSGLLTALTVLGSGGSTQDVLAAELDAAFTYTVTQDALGSRDGALAVLVRNKGEERRSFGFTVVATAADGTSLGADTGTVSELPAGRPAVVELFTDRPSRDLELLQEASFAIVAASSR